MLPIFRVENLAFDFDGLADVFGQIDGPILMHLPGAAIAGGQQIFVAIAAVGQSSGEGSGFTFRTAGKSELAIAECHSPTIQALGLIGFFWSPLLQ